MKPQGDGVFIYQFDTSTLEEPVIRYYFELRSDDGVFLYPAEDAPVHPLVVEGDRDGIELDLTETPAKIDEEAVSTGTITLNGSLEYSVKRDRRKEDTSDTKTELTDEIDFATDESADADDELDDTSRFADKDFLADYNLRLARTWEKGETMISFDANLTYTNHPLEEEDEGGLSSILMEVQRSHHHLRIGDLEIVGSELVGESLSTRGIGYQYTRGRFTGEVYYMNSRQSTIVEDSVPADADWSVQSGFFAQE